MDLSYSKQSLLTNTSDIIIGSSLCLEPAVLEKRILGRREAEVIENDGSSKTTSTRSRSLTYDRNPPSLKSDIVKVKCHSQKISIIEDSHARGLLTRLHYLIGNKTVVSSMVKPSVTFNRMCLNNLEHSADCVIVIAGSNDVYNGNSNLYLENLNATLQSFSHSCVIMGNIPYRYDLPTFGRV